MILTASSTASRCPAITVCSGLFQLATSTVPRRAGLDALQNGLRGRAQDGRHRSNADRDGFLHVSSPFMNDPDRVFEFQSPRRRQRGVFAQAVSGGQRRFDAEEGEGDETDRKDSGLRIPGQPEFLFGPFETEPGEAESQGVVGPAENFPGFGRPVVKILSHPDDLRSLAGKKTRDSTHDDFLS